MALKRFKLLMFVRASDDVEETDPVFTNSPANDITAEHIEKIGTSDEHSNSTHAATDAQKNVQSDWNITDNEDDAFIKNKPSLQGSIQTPSGTAIAFNVNNGKDAIITLSGDTILTFSNLTANDKGNFYVIGHASIKYDLTPAASSIPIEIPSASHDGGDKLLLSGAGKKDLVSWWYTGNVLVVGLAKDLI